MLCRPLLRAHCRFPRILFPASFTCIHFPAFIFLHSTSPPLLAGRSEVLSRCGLRSMVSSLSRRFGRDCVRLPNAVQRLGLVCNAADSSATDPIWCKWRSRRAACGCGSRGSENRRYNITDPSRSGPTKKMPVPFRDEQFENILQNRD